MKCENSLSIQAYYDGELAPGERPGLEDHLRQCASCRGELAELRQLSESLAGAGSPALSGAAVERLRRGIDLADGRGLLRVAEWLTAAAAVILVAGLVGLMTPPKASGGAAGWEQAAINPDSEMQASGPDTQLAAWMTGGLSSDNAGEP